MPANPLADPLPTILDTLAGAAALHKQPALDPYTLAVAEKVVRDLVLKTSWASDARLLKRAADATHQLGGTP